MDEEALVANIRGALVEAALRAYEDAGLAGLCAEGRWEAAVEALRSVDVAPLVNACLRPRPEDAGPER